MTNAARAVNIRREPYDIYMGRPPHAGPTYQPNPYRQSALPGQRPSRQQSGTGRTRRRRRKLVTADPEPGY